MYSTIRINKYSFLLVKKKKKSTCHHIFASLNWCISFARFQHNIRLLFFENKIKSWYNVPTDSNRKTFTSKNYLVIMLFYMIQESKLKELTIVAKAWCQIVNLNV